MAGAGEGRQRSKDREFDKGLDLGDRIGNRRRSDAKAVI